MLRQSSRRLSKPLLSMCRRASLTLQHVDEIFMASHFSSMPYRRLENITNASLNQTIIPRGTMSVSQIENTIEAVSAWCHNADGLTTADQLLNRLGAEFSSGSFVVQKFATNLVDSHLQVIVSSCELSPNDPNGLERAEGLLRRLVGWHQSGVVSDVPVDGLDALVRAWLALNEDAKAADLLFWWTDHFTTHEEKLVPLFHHMLKQSFDSDHVMTASLIKRMEELKNDFGWKGLGIDFPEVTPVSDDSVGVATESTPEDEARTLEMHDLMSKIIDFLQDASKEDFGRVQQYQKKLLQLTDFNLTESVCANLLDYYIRIKDSKEATGWLQRLDRFGSNLSIFDKAVDVLKLLAEGKPEGAPWRAAEIFQRMEQLEHQGAGTITSEMCHLYCIIWAQSGETATEKKTEDIVRKMMSAASAEKTAKQVDEGTYALAFDVLANTPKGAQSALALLAIQWKRFDASILEEQVGKLMEKLAGHGMAQEAGALVKLASTANLTFDDAALVNFVGVHATSSDPMATLGALDFVRQLRGGNAPFECYSRTIRALSKVRGTGAVRQEWDLITTVLSGVCNGSLSAPTEQVRHLVEYLTSTMAKKGRAKEAEKILAHVERSVSDVDRSNLDYLTTSCFNNVMSGWMEYNASRKAIVQFSRLRKYREAGLSHLKPDKASYSLVLRALSRRTDSASKAEDILAELLCLHDESTTEDLKPHDGHFKSTLIALKEEAPADLFNRSMAVLTQMKKVGLLTEHSTFNFVMNSILASSDQNKFARVMEVRQLMKEEGVTPNEVTHSMTLNACSTAGPDDIELALELAFESIAEARKSRVDLHVYTSLLKALRHLLMKYNDKRRNRVVSAFMRACRKDGLLNSKMQHQFQSLMREEQNGSR